MVDALGRLSDINRETATLYYINGYSQEDISRFTAKPLGTIKSRLHEARKQLRKELVAMVEDQLKRSRPGREFTDTVERKIGRVRVCRSGTRWDSILLTDTEGRSYQVTSGSEEAEVVERRLSGRATDADTDLFDVLLDVLAHFGCRLSEATLVPSKGKSISDTMGSLRIQSPAGVVEVEAEPADAVSLAVRAGAAIYVERSLAEEKLFRREDGRPMSPQGAWRAVGRRAKESRREERPFRDAAHVIRTLERNPESDKARRALMDLIRESRPSRVKNTNDGLGELKRWVKRCRDGALEALSTGLLGSLHLLKHLYDPDKAVRLLERAHKLAPHDSRIAFDLATAYALTKRRADALDVLEALSKVHPEPDQLAKEVAECSNFRGLWRRSSFRALFGEPIAVAQYHFKSAQTGMSSLQSQRARQRPQGGLELSRMSKPRIRTIHGILGCGPLLTIRQTYGFEEQGAGAKGEPFVVRLNDDRVVKIPMSLAEQERVNDGICQDKFIYPEANETCCGVLRAAGIKIEATVVLKAGARSSECAMITRRGEDTCITQLQGYSLLAVALWARAPVLVGEPVAEKLLARHKR